MCSFGRWAWVLAMVVSFASVTACFGLRTSNDYYDRGSARLKDENYRGAVADFDKAISIRPKYIVAYIGRGNAKIRLGRYEEAIADFDQALLLGSDLKSDELDSYRGRAFAKFMLGRYRESIADYDQVIRLQPDDAYMYFRRGRAKFEGGLYGEAFVDWQISLELAKEANSSGLIGTLGWSIQRLSRCRRHPTPLQSKQPWSFCPGLYWWWFDWDVGLGVGGGEPTRDRRAGSATLWLAPIVRPRNGKNKVYLGECGRI